MSKERELLEEIMIYFSKGDITIRKFENSSDIAETFHSVQELLAQPEQKQLTPREALAEYKKGYMIGYYIAVRDLKTKIDSVFNLIMEEGDE